MMDFALCFLMRTLQATTTDEAQLNKILVDELENFEDDLSKMFKVRTKR